MSRLTVESVRNARLSPGVVEAKHGDRLGDAIASAASFFHIHASKGSSEHTHKAALRLAAAVKAHAEGKSDEVEKHLTAFHAHLDAHQGG